MRFVTFCTRESAIFFMQTNTNNSPIRVVLVEDDVVFQQALRETVSNVPDMLLLQVASTRAEGLLALEGPVADMLLVDLGLPDGSGIDIIRAARTRWPNAASR